MIGRAPISVNQSSIARTYLQMYIYSLIKNVCPYLEICQPFDWSMISAVASITPGPAAWMFQICSANGNWWDLIMQKGMPIFYILPRQHWWWRLWWWWWWVWGGYNGNQEEWLVSSISSGDPSRMRGAPCHGALPRLFEPHWHQKIKIESQKIEWFSVVYH